MPGHPSLATVTNQKTWMAGTSPAMTIVPYRSIVISSPRARETQIMMVSLRS
jgi:hypothetical protein